MTLGRPDRERPASAGSAAGVPASANSTAPTRRYLSKATVTLFAAILVVAYLLPLAYGFITGLKSPEQMTDPRQPILPMSPETATIDGEEYPIMMVPFDDGTRELALVDKGREAERIRRSRTNPTSSSSGRAAGARSSRRPLSIFTGTTSRPWPRSSTFPSLLFNTGVIAGLGMAGTLISSVLVAYGLSRFNVPFEKLIMASLIAAIILPRFVTIVPTYAVYQRLGWIGTWLPLIIPHFFANAYNVFLLRAVLHDDPPRARRGGHDRRRRTAADTDDDHRAAGPGGDLRRRPVPLLLRLERLLRADRLPRRRPRQVPDLRRACTGSSGCTSRPPTWCRPGR